MSSKDIQVTKEDILSSDWQSMTSDCKRKECHEYSNSFREKAQEARESGNFKKHNALRFLAYVACYPIQANKADERFERVFKEITEDQLSLLAEIANEISDPELQARVADILWVKRRDYKMAQLAIPAYLESAKTLEHPEHWPPCMNRIERAFRLARKIKHREQDVLAHIEAVLDRYQGEDPMWLSAKLMELLWEHRLGDPTKYAALSEKAARYAESSIKSGLSQDWRRARELWKIEANWHHLAKDSSREIDALMLAAETYVKEAEWFLNQAKPSYIHVSGALQRAVQAFRNIQGTKEQTATARQRGEEVHKKLLEYQPRILNEMGDMSQSVDISELAYMSRKAVSGKGLPAALFALVTLASPRNISDMKQQVQQEAQRFLLSNLFPDEITNKMGKVVARQSGSVLSGNPKEAEEAINFKMCLDNTRHQSLVAQALIEPARYQINLEYDVRVSDILSVVAINNPVIPRGREYSFAKGFHAGLEGDFFTSINILIPQIENSVRHLMWQAGIITSGIDDRGIQNEHNLNTLLYRSEITRFFDENTIFDLRCLLVEHAGSNLRNRMAHGLIDDSEFVSHPIMSYTWWLTLRFCCLPILEY